MWEVGRELCSGLWELGGGGSTGGNRHGGEKNNNGTCPKRPAWRGPGPDGCGRGRGGPLEQPSAHRGRARQGRVAGGIDSDWSGGGGARAQPT